MGQTLQVKAWRTPPGGLVPVTVTLRDAFNGVYEQYGYRAGEPFELLEVLDEPREGFLDATCSPMYRIKFQDGEIISAWPEEVEEW